VDRERAVGCLKGLERLYRGAVDPAVRFVLQGVIKADDETDRAGVTRVTSHEANKVRNKFGKRCSTFRVTFSIITLMRIVATQPANTAGSLVR
jgi:hypothetical protein